MRTLFALLLSCVIGQAATITPADLSYSAVNSAIGTAVNGDTVQLPSGRTNWTTQLVVSKAIWLTGPSDTNAVITSGVADGTPLIVWNLVTNLPSRMSYIQFTNGTVAQTYGQHIQVNGVNGDARNMRLDHCFFNNLTHGTYLIESANGVADHNIIIGALTALIGYVKGSSYGYTQGTPKWGDGAWGAPDGFGGTNFFFFEDNIVSNAWSSQLTLMDSQAGGRYVFRNNRIYKGSIESHGLEAARERSGRAFEIYNNTFDGNDSSSLVTYFRGGVGLVYSNYVYGYGSAPVFYLLNNRMNDSIAEPFGGCDGRNPWDTNDTANPYVTATATSAGTLTVTVSGASWTPGQWAGYIIRRTSGKSVSSMTRSGSTVTANCTAHGFTNGQYVSIFGALGTNMQPYNYIYAIASNSANQFTFANSWTPNTPATGTILACAGNFFSEITTNTATQITFRDTIYYTGDGRAADGRRMAFAAADTFEINKVIHAMDQTGRGFAADLGGVDDPAIPAGWNNQATSAWYAWNNVKCTSGPAVIGAPGTPIRFATTPILLIQEGVHFNNATEKPGYTALAYPHYLVSGIEPGPGDPPPTPSNRVLNVRSARVGRVLAP